MVKSLRFVVHLNLLAVLLAETASADPGLPDELNAELQCPLQNDWQGQSRAPQVQAELNQIVQQLNYIYAEAHRSGTYTDASRSQIAQIMPRKQALERELWQLNQRAAQLSQGRQACIARIRDARVQRISTTPANVLRAIPENLRIPEESAAIAAAEAQEAVAAAAPPAPPAPPALPAPPSLPPPPIFGAPQRAAAPAPPPAGLEFLSKDQTLMDSASPQAIREILSAHLCNWKRQLAVSEAENKGDYHKGQFDGEVNDWKEYIAANARLFKVHNLTPLACNTKRVKLLMSCLPSVYDTDGVMFTPNLSLCTDAEKPLIALDRLLETNGRLDICFDNGHRRACPDKSQQSAPSEKTASGMTFEKAKKLGLSETKVALSARRCLYTRMLRQLAKKPDPTAETPATWNALLTAVNQMLADTKLKPVSCEDREIKIAITCLPSVLGGVMGVPLLCTNDVFMRHVVQVDDAIPLGVEIPEEKGTHGELEQKVQERLRAIDHLETETKCIMVEKRKTMVITITAGSDACSGSCLFGRINDAFDKELRRAHYEMLILREKQKPNGRTFTEIKFPQPGDE